MRLVLQNLTQKKRWNDMFFISLGYLRRAKLSESSNKQSLFAASPEYLRTWHPKYIEFHLFLRSVFNVFEDNELRIRLLRLFHHHVCRACYDNYNQNHDSNCIIRLAGLCRLLGLGPLGFRGGPERYSSLD